LEKWGDDSELLFKEREFDEIQPIEIHAQ
jgi:hypothetical protein